eukprot:m.230713 g.230713  ORF g.230713 m.230713 type:complete len:694 (+) comp18127_c0_seq1:386-2467(+)
MRDQVLNRQKRLGIWSDFVFVAPPTDFYVLDKIVLDAQRIVTRAGVALADEVGAVGRRLQHAVCLGAWQLAGKPALVGGGQRGPGRRRAGLRKALLHGPLLVRRLARGWRRRRGGRQGNGGGRGGAGRLQGAGLEQRGRGHTRNQCRRAALAVQLRLHLSHPLLFQRLRLDAKDVTDRAGALAAGQDPAERVLALHVVLGHHAEGCILDFAIDHVKVDCNFEVIKSTLAFADDNPIVEEKRIADLRAILACLQAVRDIAVADKLAVALKRPARVILDASYDAFQRLLLLLCVVDVLGQLLDSDMGVGEACLVCVRCAGVLDQLLEEQGVLEDALHGHVEQILEPEPLLTCHPCLLQHLLDGWLGAELFKLGHCLGNLTTEAAIATKALNRLEEAATDKAAGVGLHLLLELGKKSCVRAEEILNVGENQLTLGARDCLWVCHDRFHEHIDDHFQQLDVVALRVQQLVEHTVALLVLGAAGRVDGLDLAVDDVRVDLLGALELLDRCAQLPVDLSGLGIVVGVQRQWQRRRGLGKVDGLAHKRLEGLVHVLAILLRRVGCALRLARERLKLGGSGGRAREKREHRHNLGKVGGIVELLGGEHVGWLEPKHSRARGHKKIDVLNLEKLFFGLSMEVLDGAGADFVARLAQHCSVLKSHGEVVHLCVLNESSAVGSEHAQRFEPAGGHLPKFLHGRV